VNWPLFHDHEEVLYWILEPLEVRDRIAVHQQRIGQRTLLNDADLALVRVAGT
jgi:hypothetical protein